MTPPYCCTIQCLPRNLATHGAEQSEGKGGDARRGSAPLLLCNHIPQGFCASAVTAWGEYTTVCLVYYCIYMYYFDDYLLITASMLCDKFCIKWLRPCMDVLDHLINTIKYSIYSVTWSPMTKLHEAAEDSSVKR
jgi:hypothetical protein